jgi:polysaccharide biosynthesis transport protein
VLRELNPASGAIDYGPFPGRYIGGGAVVGILLMCGLALLMDMADRSYRSPDEIVADLGRPVLGHVPAMDLPNIKRVVESVDESIITLHHSRGRIAEAFRSVRTGLFFSSRGSDLKVVQVTSPVPGDGKSTLCANLAVTMAQSGRRVLLIDADFRRPRLHKLFGIDVKEGLAQCVSGESELDEVMYTTCVANLTLMPGGQRPSNPAELLSSSRFAELLEVLKEKYDIIIIDTPPTLAVSDPSVVASLVDGVVLAMRLRRNVKPLASRAFRVLESVDAQILGVVVNGVSTEAAYGGYGYNYSYNDYRYSYRSNYNYADAYRRYNNYAEYSAGYIEDKQSDSLEADLKNNDAHS